MFGLFSLIILINFSLAQFLNTTDSKLVTVFVIFRHGDRTPISPYPTDPYKDNKFWPVGFGQLTNKGKEQEYELGQWLRNRYNNFLPAAYSEKDIYVRSTDVDRTLMSAEVNLAGLYPPVDKNMWNRNLVWQPIPVHTKPELEDATLAMKKPCPKYEYLEKQLHKDPEILKIIKRNHDLFSYIARNAGKKVTSLKELEYIYSTLNIEKENNFTLPNWTNRVFPDKMKPLAELTFALPCYTKPMARLKVGPLLNEMKGRILNVTENKSNQTHPKIWMYSGHDTTIASVLKSLDLFENHAPPFTATILFEIYRKDNDHYLNIFYKNTSVPLKMTLHGCDFNCPIDNFLKIIDPLTINLKDWLIECQMSYLPFDLFGDIVILIIMFITVFAISCILIAILFTKRKNEKLTYLRLPDNDETV